jgi:hypothetical protein
MLIKGRKAIEAQARPLDINKMQNACRRQNMDPTGQTPREGPDEGRGLIRLGLEARHCAKHKPL